MDEPRRSGLREARRDRGWTQEEAADQLARLAWIRRGERVGVNADMIAKWERGDKSPSSRYRELLCLLYGATPEYLGIARVTKSKTSPSPEPASPAVTERSLVDALGGAAAILDQLGTAGGILAPRMFDAWKDDVMQRRAMLKLMGIMPAVTVLPSATESTRRSRSGKPTPDNVRDMEYLADRYQTLYHSTAPAALMTPVVAHLSTLGDLLRQDPGPAERRRLLANRARVGTLAGRLSFFDLQDSMAARAYYSLALEAAREADDHLQAAAALAHVAFIPAAEHGFSAALDYLYGATDHLRSQPCGPIASWLSAVESEMHTNAGNATTALHAIDRARDALTAPGLTPELPWFDYYDATRLHGFAGYPGIPTCRPGRLLCRPAMGIPPPRSGVRCTAITPSTSSQQKVPPLVWPLPIALVPTSRAADITQDQPQAVTAHSDHPYATCDEFPSSGQAGPTRPGRAAACSGQRSLPLRSASAPGGWRATR